MLDANEPGGGELLKDGLIEIEPAPPKSNEVNQFDYRMALQPNEAGRRKVHDDNYSCLPVASSQILIAIMPEGQNIETIRPAIQSGHTFVSVHCDANILYRTGRALSWFCF